MDSETVEEIKRHFGVVAEDVRSEIRIVAEGQELLRHELAAKIDGIAQVMQLTYSELTGRLDDHDSRLRAVEGPRP